MRPATGRWVLAGAFAVVGVAGGLIGAAIASPELVVGRLQW